MGVSTVLPAITIAISITAYILFVIIYASKLSRNGLVCIYAIVENQDALDSKNYTWEIPDSSLIYAPFRSISSPRTTERSSAKTVTNDVSSYDVTCNELLVDPAAVIALSSRFSGRNRLRFVVGTRNCAAYLWIKQIKWLMISALLYCTYYIINYWRRMFGVVRNQKYTISPTMFPMNYTIRVISTVFAKTRYTKMNNLMCELSIHRNAANRRFISDPISFLWYNPSVMIMILVEFIIRLCAQCSVLAVISAMLLPCSKLYSVMFKTITGIFVTSVTLSEISFIVYYSTREKNLYRSSAIYGTEVSNCNQSQEQKLYKACYKQTIFTNCCANVISGLVAKILHMLFVIIVICVLVRYEQKLQSALLSGL